MADLIGQSLSRYQILEPLGEGGMATVYRAYDTRLERDVAIKIIRRGAFPPDSMARVLERFEREAKALARLSHLNIVGVIDYGEYEGAPYLVLEFLPGQTLKQRLGRAMPWQQAVRLLVPVARALAHAHRQGILHRDVKPSNILITEDGEPMLTDFGVAKLLDAQDTLELTGTGVGVGTPEYMAPEQATSKAVDARADVYALGVVLYEMLTGCKPYTADTPLAVLMKHASEPLPRPRQFAPGLPQPVENVLFKALAKDPKDRYADMAAFAAALDGVLLKQSGSPAPAPVSRPVPRAVPAAQARPPAAHARSIPRRWLWGGAAFLDMAVIAALALNNKPFAWGPPPAAASDTPTAIASATSTSTPAPSATPGTYVSPTLYPPILAESLAGIWQGPAGLRYAISARAEVTAITDAANQPAVIVSQYRDVGGRLGFTYEYLSGDNRVSETIYTEYLSGDKLYVRLAPHQGSGGTGPVETIRTRVAQSALAVPSATPFPTIAPSALAGTGRSDTGMTITIVSDGSGYQVTSIANGLKRELTLKEQVWVDGQLMFSFHFNDSVKVFSTIST